MSQSARSSLDDATHLARVWYMAHGGKASDLTDYDQNVAALDKLIQSLNQ